MITHDSLLDFTLFNLEGLIAFSSPLISLITLANSNQRYNKMCDTALSCARDHLLPLAHDHLLPLLKEAFNMIRVVPKEIAELKEELESIEDFKIAQLSPLLEWEDWEKPL
ncbi:transmembrane protein, putative [Medicago truncatula]|uniref:Transmembrane protein, putative n=1 Tax=Medicago truncatula TaxID=3880 RepID=A0A072UWK8_MEDTR|nr:transmembrane protein, putative [Medicago truncatula]